MIFLQSLLGGEIHIFAEVKCYFFEMQYFRFNFKMLTRQFHDDEHCLGCVL